MIEIVWEFIVKEEARGQFELAFGPGGAWSKLFARSPGFRGTTLLRDTQNPRRYLTVDIWDMLELREQALADHEAEYADLSAEPGVEIELPAECLANPENCGALVSESPTEFSDEQSLVPYDQVFGDYRNAAYEALQGDYIPLGMKIFVRDYFSSLEP